MRAFLPYGDGSGRGIVRGMTKGSVTVGVDTTPGSLDALAWAIGECRAQDADLVLMHSPDQADLTLAGDAAPSADPLHDVAQAVLDVHRSVAEQVAGDVPVLSVISDVSAAQALIDASRTATLVVLGSRGPVGFGESALGSVAHRVAVHVHCPVVVVPHASIAPSTVPSRRIVVGIGVGVAGRKALAFAADRAEREGATLVLVRSTRTAGESAGPDAGTLLSAAQAEVAAAHPGLAVQIVAAPTDPVTAVLDQAAHADLVVLGCHHSEDRWNTRLGAVPVGVLAGTTRPVVLVGQQH